MIKKLREIINKIRWFDNQFITFRKNETINSKIFFLVNLFYIFLSSILNFFYKKFFISFFLLFNKVSSIFFDKKINVDFVSNKNKKCFIIGNGPSLKRQDLLKLKEQDVFVCNNFAMCFKNINFNPKYYLLADAHGYFSKKKIDRRGDPNDIKYIFEKNINSTFLIPDFLKKNFLKTIHYKKNKFFFYKTFPISLEEYTQKNINFQKGIPWAFNSLLINIYIAIAMGYKKIYLLGADQDLYLKDSYCTELKKYYQNKKLKKKNRYQMIATCNNFIGSWSTFRLMQSHYSLSKYCKTNNINIMNLSQHGILDMYRSGEIKNIIK